MFGIRYYREIRDHSNRAHIGILTHFAGQVVGIIGSVVMVAAVLVPLINNFGAGSENLKGVSILEMLTTKDMVQAAGVMASALIPFLGLVLFPAFVLLDQFTNPEAAFRRTAALLYGILCLIGLISVVGLAAMSLWADFVSASQSLGFLLIFMGLAAVLCDHGMRREVKRTDHPGLRLSAQHVRIAVLSIFAAGITLVTIKHFNPALFAPASGYRWVWLGIVIHLLGVLAVYVGSRLIVSSAENTAAAPEEVSG